MLKPRKKEEEIQDMVIFVAGGLTNQVVQRNDPRTEALFNPKTGSFCDIPQLPTERNGPANFGFTVCGGFNHKNCSTFDPRTGNWNPSWTCLNQFPHDHFRSASWESSNGVYLMGGDFSDTKTPLLLPDDSCQPGFDLAYPITGFCTISDAETGTVITTGGRSLFTSSGNSNRVTRYGTNGFIEDLPPLNAARWIHGCGSYRNEDGKMVLMVVGGQGSGQATGN